MELRQIKELMAAMGRTCTKRLHIKQENFELELEREEYSERREIEPETPEEAQGMAGPVAVPSYKIRTADIPTSLHSPLHTAMERVKEETGELIKSPMVGTFYVSADPEEPPFVKVGDKVEKDTVVCIIEAMKVMNEVKSGVEGTVAEIFVDNSHPVEFGTKLFKISSQ